MQDRNIDVYLFDSNWQRIISTHVYVSAGVGTQEIEIAIPSSTEGQTDAIWSASLWAGDWSARIKTNYVFGVRVQPNGAEEEQGSLDLTSVCSEKPNKTRRWSVTNTYNSPKPCKIIGYLFRLRFNHGIRAARNNLCFV
jgi:hypothetical protein